MNYLQFSVSVFTAESRVFICNEKMQKWAERMVDNYRRLCLIPAAPRSLVRCTLAFFSPSLQTFPEQIKLLRSGRRTGSCSARFTHGHAVVLLLLLYTETIREGMHPPLAPLPPSFSSFLSCVCPSQQLLVSPASSRRISTPWQTLIDKSFL